MCYVGTVALHLTFYQSVTHAYIPVACRARVPEAAVMLEGRPVKLRVEAPSLDWAKFLLIMPLFLVGPGLRLAMDTDLGKKDVFRKTLRTK